MHDLLYFSSPYQKQPRTHTHIKCKSFIVNRAWEGMQCNFVLYKLPPQQAGTANVKSKIKKDNKGGLVPVPPPPPYTLYTIHYIQRRLRYFRPATGHHQRSLSWEQMFRPLEDACSMVKQLRHAKREYASLHHKQISLAKSSLGLMMFPWR